MWIRVVFSSDLQRAFGSSPTRRTERQSTRKRVTLLAGAHRDGRSCSDQTTDGECRTGPRFLFLVPSRGDPMKVLCVGLVFASHPPNNPLKVDLPYLKEPKARPPDSWTLRPSTSTPHNSSLADCPGKESGDRAPFGSDLRDIPTSGEALLVQVPSILKTKKNIKERLEKKESSLTNPLKTYPCTPTGTRPTLFWSRGAKVDRFGSYLNRYLGRTPSRGRPSTVLFRHSFQVGPDHIFVDGWTPTCAFVRRSVGLGHSERGYMRGSFFFVATLSGTGTVCPQGVRADGVDLLLSP